MKKLLMLGGLRYLIPVIEAAHKLGIFVITCDYLPDNIAHKYSDKYINASIIDKEAILNIAKEEKIDGIMSFAVDPGVVTAAYVAEQLNLPHSGTYKSILILQNKHLFRKFLEDNGFNVPKSKGYSNYIDALNDKDYFTWPIIVKPVDSAGSKGVMRVDNIEELEKAVEFALNNSLSKQIIIEEFIEKQGFSSDTDCFSVNGELKFVSFSAQRFDENAPNPYTPSAFSWPSTMTELQEKELSNDIQRLLKLLNMRTSIYNIETRVGKNGKTYIMEVSPRGGGNRLAEMLRFATGVDMIENAVRASIGDEIIGIEQKPYNGHWSEIILHSEKEGKFERLDIEKGIKEKNVFQEDLWVEKGDKVNSFNGANDAIGTLVLRFDNEIELQQAMSNRDELVKVIVK